MDDALLRLGAAGVICLVLVYVCYTLKNMLDSALEKYEKLAEKFVDLSQKNAAAVAVSTDAIKAQADTFKELASEVRDSLRTPRQ